MSPRGLSACRQTSLFFERTCGGKGASERVHQKGCRGAQRRTGGDDEREESKCVCVCVCVKGTREEKMQSNEGEGRPKEGRNGEYRIENTAKGEYEG